MTIHRPATSASPAPSRHRPREWLLAAVVALALHLACLGDRPAAMAWRQAGAPAPSVPAPPVLTVRRIDPAPTVTLPVRAGPPARPARPAVITELAPAPQRRPSAPDPAVAAAAGPEEAPSVAPAATSPPIDGGAPPTYATRLPPAFRRAYALERAGLAGSAELTFELDDEGYRLALHSRLPGRPDTGLSSRGRLDAHGLAPERVAEARRGRERRAAHFDRAAARITYSGPQTRHELLPGAQDSLSWLVQLAAVLAAEPGSWSGGRVIHLPVSGTRGDAGVWTFVVQGEDAVGSADGRARPALHLVREPARPYDTRAEVWLDPADHHLPLRLRLTHPPGAGGLELRRADEASP